MYCFEIVGTCRWNLMDLRTPDTVTNLGSFNPLFCGNNSKLTSKWHTCSFSWRSTLRTRLRNDFDCNFRRFVPSGVSRFLHTKKFNLNLQSSSASNSHLYLRINCIQATAGTGRIRTVRQTFTEMISLQTVFTEDELKLITSVARLPQLTPSSTEYSRHSPVDTPPSDNRRRPTIPYRNRAADTKRHRTAERTLRWRNAGSDRIAPSSAIWSDVFLRWTKHHNRPDRVACNRCRDAIWTDGPSAAMHNIAESSPNRWHDPMHTEKLAPFPARRCTPDKVHFWCWFWWGSTEPQSPFRRRTNVWHIWSRIRRTVNHHAQCPRTRFHGFRNSRGCDAVPERRPNIPDLDGR